MQDTGYHARPVTVTEERVKDAMEKQAKQKALREALDSQLQERRGSEANAPKLSKAQQKRQEAMLYKQTSGESFAGVGGGLENGSFAPSSDNYSAYDRNTIGGGGTMPWGRDEGHHTPPSAGGGGSGAYSSNSLPPQGTGGTLFGAPLNTSTASASQQHHHHPQSIQHNYYQSQLQQSQQHRLHPGQHQGHHPTGGDSVQHHLGGGTHALRQSQSGELTDAAFNNYQPPPGTVDSSFTGVGTADVGGNSPVQFQRGGGNAIPAPPNENVTNLIKQSSQLQRPSAPSSSGQQFTSGREEGPVRHTNNPVDYTSAMKFASMASEVPESPPMHGEHQRTGTQGGGVGRGRQEQVDSQMSDYTNVGGGSGGVQLPSVGRAPNSHGAAPNSKAKADPQAKAAKNRVDKLEKELTDRQNQMDKMRNKERDWEQQVRQLKGELKQAKMKERDLNKLVKNKQAPRAETAPNVPGNAPPVSKAKRLQPLDRPSNPGQGQGRRPPLGGGGGGTKSHQQGGNRGGFNETKKYAIANNKAQNGETFRPITAPNALDPIGYDQDDGGTGNSNLPPLPHNLKASFDASKKIAFAQSKKTDAEESTSKVPIALDLESLQGFSRAQIITSQQVTALWAFFSENCGGTTTAAASSSSTSPVNTTATVNAAGGGVQPTTRAGGPSPPLDPRSSNTSFHSHAFRETAKPPPPTTTTRSTYETHVELEQDNEDDDEEDDYDDEETY